MKKLLLSLGAVAAVAAPVAAVVACGSTTEKGIEVKEIAITDAPTTSTLLNGVLTVKVQTSTDDFESGVSAKIADAIQQSILVSTTDADSKDAELKLVKSIRVIVQDSTATVKAADATVAISPTDHPRQGINEAINKVSKAIAESGILENDQAASDSDYVADMVTRIEAVITTGDKVVAANNLLKAIGNGTRFTEEKKTISALGYVNDYTRFTTTNPNKLLNAILSISGTYDDAVVSAFHTASAKLA